MEDTYEGLFDAVKEDTVVSSNKEKKTKKKR